MSVALTETSASKGFHVRSSFVLTTVLAATILGISPSYLQEEEVVVDMTVKEIEGYKERIAELEGSKEYQEQQFRIFAQELGTLQARLERFDAISEKIMNDKDLGKHLQTDEEGAVTGKGSASMDDMEETEAKTLEELKLDLSLLNDAADHVSTAFDIGMNLLSENYLSNLQQPYTWPVVHERTYKSSSYGWRQDPFSHKNKWHAGIDIAGGYNAPIVSSASGLVLFSGYRYGYGIMVEIMHAGGYVTRYGHLNKALAVNGSQVKAGDLIGLMGSTGRSTGPHLHFEVLLNDKKVDPLPFIRGGKDDARKLAKEEDYIASLEQNIHAH